MSKAYLCGYNLASAGGWAYCLYLTAQALQAGLPAAKYFALVEQPLKITQTMAILEMAHSLLRLVRSPFGPTFMQVMSRVIVLWGYTNSCTKAQAHWSLYLMVTSWCLVEVPRYLFYAANLFSKEPPAPLFWLRYNLFSILYPTGITGEMLQMWNCLAYFGTISQVLRGTGYFTLFVWFCSSFIMYSHMVKQRKRASRNRKNAKNPKPKAAPNGLLWPVTNQAKGERSTTATNKAIFEASVAGLNAEEAAKIAKERNWRFKYYKYVVNNVKLSCDSPSTALKIATAGLKSAYETFEFVRDEKSMSFEEAMGGCFKGSYENGFIKGSKAKPKAGFELEVPYKNKVLKGKALLDQLDKWVDYGTIEPSSRDAIAYCVNNNEKLDLSDQYFVLLGAGSAMGPLLVLMALGANVIAVDLDRQGIWERLLKIARDSCGTMYFPLKKPQGDLSDSELAKIAGGNLFTDCPEICNWVSEVCPGKPLTIGGYAYLDGALHVQVSLAMDAIMGGVAKRRKNVALAYLCSPTDVFVCQPDAAEAMKTNLKKAPLWQKIIASLSGGRALTKNKYIETVQDEFNIVDGIVVAQGPNYALAKRLQHWRAMLHKSAGGVVSSNIAPSTATASVVSNKSFAMAYGGFKFFKPMEVMYQETSNAVMGALLIHDVVNKAAPSQKHVKGSNPLLLFGTGAFHGGIWRCGWKMNSIGAVSVTAFLLENYGPSAAALIAALVAGGVTMAQSGFMPEFP